MDYIGLLSVYNKQFILMIIDVNWRKFQHRSRDPHPWRRLGPPPLEPWAHGSEPSTKVRVGFNPKNLGIQQNLRLWTRLFIECIGVSKLGNFTIWVSIAKLWGSEGTIPHLFCVEGAKGSSFVASPPSRPVTSRSVVNAKNINGWNRRGDINNTCMHRCKQKLDVTSSHMIWIILNHTGR